MWEIEFMDGEKVSKGIDPNDPPKQAKSIRLINYDLKVDVPEGAKPVYFKEWHYANLGANNCLAYIYHIGYNINGHRVMRTHINKEYDIEDDLGRK